MDDKDDSYDEYSFLNQNTLEQKIEKLEKHLRIFKS